jgi:hypothetical protein
MTCVHPGFVGHLQQLADLGVQPLQAAQQHCFQECVIAAFHNYSMGWWLGPGVGRQRGMAWLEHGTYVHAC